MTSKRLCANAHSQLLLLAALCCRAASATEKTWRQISDADVTPRGGAFSNNTCSILIPKTPSLKSYIIYKCVSEIGRGGQGASLETTRVFVTSSKAGIVPRGEASTFLDSTFFNHKPLNPRPPSCG